MFYHLSHEPCRKPLHTSSYARTPTSHLWAQVKQVSSEVEMAWRDVISPGPLSIAQGKASVRVSSAISPSSLGLVASNGGSTKSDIEDLTPNLKAMHDRRPLDAETYPTALPSNASKHGQGSTYREAHSVIPGAKTDVGWASSWYCETRQSHHEAGAGLARLELKPGISANNGLTTLGMYIAKLRTTKDIEIKVDE